VRVIAGEEQVITIHITASLESCLSRNRERARPIPERAVRIIHSEFERPERPDLYIDTDKLSLEQAVAAVLRHLSNIQS
jgi:adenylylsulfate kinase